MLSCVCCLRERRKIDCTTPDEAPSIAGYLKGDTVYINIASAFGGNGRAKLYRDETKKQLVWKMKEHSGMHHLPVDEVWLSREEITGEQSRKNLSER